MPNFLKNHFYLHEALGIHLKSMVIVELSIWLSVSYHILVQIFVSWESWGGYHPNRHFLLMYLVAIIKLIQFSLIFLLLSKRRFQCTKEDNIWIPYAKVMKGQNFWGRGSKIAPCPKLPSSITLSISQKSICTYVEETHLKYIQLCVSYHI